MYNYVINESNTVEVFIDGQELPMLRQPNYPNGDSFDSYSEAEDWAKLFILALEDKSNAFAPNGKGLVGESQPTDQDILDNLKKTAAEFGENVPQDLTNAISDLESKLNN